MGLAAAQDEGGLLSRQSQGGWVDLPAVQNMGGLLSLLPQGGWVGLAAVQDELVLVVVELNWNGLGYFLG